MQINHMGHLCVGLYLIIFLSAGYSLLELCLLCFGSLGGGRTDSGMGGLIEDFSKEHRLLPLAVHFILVCPVSLAVSDVIDS